MRIKKGDTVKIIAGKDKGKTGKVLTVDFARRRITVEGLNMFKKHARSKRQGEKGQIVSLPRPLAASNVMAMCGSCGRAVRSGVRLEGATKVRYCKKCNTTL